MDYTVLVVFVSLCSFGLLAYCSSTEPYVFRLVGAGSRCRGDLEVRDKQTNMTVHGHNWNLTMTNRVCAQLNCGTAVSVTPRQKRNRMKIECMRKFGWRCRPVMRYVGNMRDMRNMGIVGPFYESDSLHRFKRSLTSLEITCSDLLHQPNISLSVSTDGVSEAQPQGLLVLLGSDFSVRCSVEPQYPGGLFQLLSPTLDPTQNHTLPAVNHSAHFLFATAGPAHKGGYTCVYHLHVFSHDFSSQSQTLYLTLGAYDSELIIRVVVILLLKLIYITAFYFYYHKATRGLQPRRQ